MASAPIVTKTENHSLPGNYVTATFLAGGQAEAFPEASTSEADGNRPASPRIERLACHVTKRSIAAAAA
jgi:hypothetical protein